MTTCDKEGKAHKNIAKYGVEGGLGLFLKMEVLKYAYDLVIKLF
jgi:hypothetical protein